MRFIVFFVGSLFGSVVTAEMDMSQMFNAMSKMMRMSNEFQQYSDRAMKQIPGLKPMPSMKQNSSKGNIISGTWQGQNGIVMVLKDGQLELFGQDTYLTGIYMLYQDRLIIYVVKHDKAHRYQFAIKDKRMILKDKSGRMIYYVKRKQ